MLPASTLALLPAALTILITLQTVEIKNIFTYCVYWIAFFGLAMPGCISLAWWWRTFGAVESLANRVRARMPQGHGVPVEEPPADPKSDTNP